MSSVQNMTGFQIFAGEVRDAVVKEIEEGKGEATDKEVGRRITKRFKDLSEADKKEYEDKAEAEKVPVKTRAAKPRAASKKQAKSGAGDAKTRKRPRAKKDPNAPKRNLPAYFFFSQDHRITLKAENPGLSFQDVGRQCGEKWRSLTDEEKAPYVKKAEVDKARYQREMEAYKKKQAESGAGDAAAADDAE